MAFRTASPLQGRALFEHMRRVSEVSRACRHCGAETCPCGQKEASEVVERCILLPMPDGSHTADMLADGMRRRIPAGPRYTRDQIEILARGADDLAGYYRLGRRPEEAAECAEVAMLAREAAAKLP